MTETAIQKALKRYSRKASEHVEPEELSPGEALIKVRELIATTRIRAEASSIPGLAGIAATAPMVSIFDLPLPVHESLSGDRDVQKREEKIRALLNERGNQRLLGAVAGPALASSLEALGQSHPNFWAATEHLLGEEALARLSGGAITGMRLLLTGPPGVGKTDFCLTLAERLGVSCQVISMSSAQASATLGGSEAHWSNTQPGAVWKAIVHGMANPLFVLDEAEKAASNWGDPLGAMFQLCEPKTAQVFRDKSVPWMTVNASYVNWILTVNDADQLHEALRSRFIEIHVGPPDEAKLRKLCQRLYADLLAEFDLSTRFPSELARESVDRLLSGSIRDAKRLLRSALAKALRLGWSALVIERPAESVAAHRIGFV